VPNRVLREGIITSDRVDALGVHAEVFYRRLMSVVDDYGRFDGRASMLRSSLYPLRIDKVREADISRWLAEVQSAGLVALYAIDGKPYIQLLDFRQHIRAMQSKFPAPPDDALHTQCIRSADEVHPRSETETETETKAHEDAGASSRRVSSRNGKPAPTGPPSKPPRKPRKSATGPAAELERVFCEQWQKRYGKPYPWHRGKDDAHNRWIRDHAGSPDEVREIIERYIASDDPFVSNAKHTIGVLVSTFARFQLPDEIGENGNGLAPKITPTPAQVRAVIGGGR
jgi:hypothetical protein